ncbi:MAG: RpiB/LacA/LacB family sugar-phosphate isomerase, partial [Clostridia bacterium]|nr:RpiB/LacA/LacB family sugar-phosphate isomerase [Clostridia bacterium]
MIAIASDHAALDMKKTVMELLTEMGLEYTDFGTYTTDS